MGKIKTLIANELVGGTTTEKVYPVTSTLAVFDSNNNSLDASLTAMNSVITTQGNSITILENRTTSLESSIINNTADINTNTDSIASLNTRVTALEDSDISDYGSRIEVLETLTSALPASNVVIDTDNTTLSTWIISMESRVSALEFKSLGYINASIDASDRTALTSFSSIADVAETVPVISRVLGCIISYYGTDSTWHRYQYSGTTLDSAWTNTSNWISI